MPTPKLIHAGSSPIVRTILVATVAMAMIACCRQAPAAEAPAAKAPAATAPAAKAKPQGYVDPPVDESQRSKRSLIMQILRARKFEAGQEEIFDKYYKTYALPRWAQRKNYESVTLYTKDLRNELMTGKSGPPYDRLNALALDYLGKMSRSATVHPVVRFNAMLMIGDLNATQPSGRELGTVLPEALPVLLAALDNAEQIDAVKVAALAGIIRHCQLGIVNEQDRAKVLADMLKLAAAKSAPGRSAEGHAWMRGQAVEALAALGAKYPASTGNTAKTLAAILSEPTASLPLKCTVAWALGELKYSGAGGLDLPNLVNQLGGLAAEICDTESKRLEKMTEEAKPKDNRRRVMPMGPPMGGEGMMGEMGMGDMGGMGNYGRRARSLPFEKLFKASRRGMMDRLGDVRHGLEAVSRVAGGSNQQATIAALQKQIDALIKEMDDPDWDDFDPDYAEEDTLIGLLKKERSKFRALLSSDAKPTKPAPKKAGE